MYTMKVIIVWGKDLLVFSTDLISHIFSVTFIIKYFSSPAWLSRSYRCCETILVILSEFPMESFVDLCCVFSFQMSVICILSFYLR